MSEPTDSGAGRASLLPRPSFARSALTTYGTNVAVAVLSFASVLITARALGVSGRGDVAFLTTVAFLSSQFTTLGVQQANANFAGREPELSPALAATSLALAAAAGLGAAAVVAGLMLTFPSLGGGAGVALLALVLASLPMLVLQAYLQQLVLAQYGFGLSNAAWLITPLTNVTVNGVLASLGLLTVGSAVAAWIGGQLLTTLVLSWAVARRLGGFGRPQRALARRMVAFGLKAHLGRAMLIGNYRLDQWILGVIAGPRELGLYSVAVAWSEVLFFLPTALTMVQRPDLVRDRPQEAQRRAALVFRAAALVTLLGAVAMIVFAPFLCATLFGESFRDSVDMLRVLALGAVGIAALKLLGNALTAQRKPMLETAAVGVAFVAVIALDLLLIPEHGGLGAAIASAVSYTVGGLAVAAIFARALGGKAGDLLPRAGDLAWLARTLRGVVKRAGPAPGD